MPDTTKPKRKSAKEALAELRTRRGEGSERPSAKEALRALRASKQAAPATPPERVVGESGAERGVFDSGMNQLTVGLHQKLTGVADAAADVITRGTQSHPLDTYHQSIKSMDERIAAAGKKHPNIKNAADATGFFGTIALEAPLRAALGLGHAVQGASAVEQAPGIWNGIKGAVTRTAKNTGKGAAIGAAGTYLASNEPADKRLQQMLAGGVLGGAFAGAPTALAEVYSGGKSILQKLLTPAEEKGAKIARQQIMERLSSRGMAPEDLVTNARQLRSPGARVAHAGTSALDDLSYLGASSGSASGAAFKESLENAQRGERDLLQEGVTALSGRERAPRNTTTTFLSGLEDARLAAGRQDYPTSYGAPAVENPRILSAVKADPDLRDALEEGLDTIIREDQLANLQRGTPLPSRANPLDVAVEPQLTETGRQLLALGVPSEKIAAAGHLTAAADSPALPVKLLDYTKRGIEPVIQRKMQREGLQPHDADILRAKMQTLLRMVDDEVPEYGAARARQASFFGREEGGKAGIKAFQRTPDENRAAMSELTRPGQAEAYRTTATSELRDLIDDPKYDTNVGRSVFDSPHREGNLDVLYGEGARERLRPFLDEAQTLNRVRQAATGGSQTEPRQATRAAVTAASGADIPLSVRGVVRTALGEQSPKVQRTLSEVLARELNIPANSPELPSLVDRLYQSLEFLREAPELYGGTRQGVALGGRLAAELARNVQ